MSDDETRLVTSNDSFPESDCVSLTLALLVPSAEVLEEERILSFWRCNSSYAPGFNRTTLKLVDNKKARLALSQLTDNDLIERARARRQRRIWRSERLDTRQRRRSCLGPQLRDTSV